MSQWVLNMNLNQKKVHHQLNIESKKLIKRPNIKQELHIFVEKYILKEDHKRITLVLDTTMVTLLNLEEISLIKWTSEKNINFNQRKVQHQVNIDQMTPSFKVVANWVISALQSHQKEDQKKTLQDLDTMINT
tara:strand:+ start:567 stop:965 length:399 start_codon:yes stop_codon:yes gene_type:complete